MEHSSLDIKLLRPDRVYRSGELIQGSVVVNAYKGWSHNGLNLVAQGVLHLSTVSRGIMSSIGADSSKQYPILRHEILISPSGRFADGSTEIPFEFPVQVSPSFSAGLVESYHGIYVSIIYSISVTCDRGMMKKSLSKDMEFVIEVPSSRPPEETPSPFNISPESLENVSSSILSTIPKFRISGRLHRSCYPINQPFTGEMVVEECEAPLRSIELQLVRVETVNLEGQGQVKEASEVQNIQIGDGNLCRGVVVPLYMVFPRLFSCPTVQTPVFRVEFEVNLIVVFGDGYMITENFPILLVRER